MDRHAATRRLKHLAHTAGFRTPRMHPHMLRHTFVTTMLDANVSLRDVQIDARTPTREPPCATTEPERTSTATPTTSSPRTWPPGHSQRSRLCRCACGGLEGSQRR
ncbi:tyrosine-type recombinase/integrase [Micromonospora chersina]|uniref:tyrosine-type recombinase/integrase n=1 Tax=Micromonospora chersina TaxID=47854 RepID=UPI0033CE37C8